MGEFDLIARLVELVAGAGGAPDAGGRIVIGSGDDAAVTEPPGVTATSVDALVDGVHFRRETAPLESIGHKAIAAGLSDLAAMGATPGEAYVQLGVPRGPGRGRELWRWAGAWRGPRRPTRSRSSAAT